MKRPIFALFVLFAILSSALAKESAPAAPYAPFVNGSTFAIIKVEPHRLPFEKIGTLGKILPEESAEKEMLTLLRPKLETLRKMADRLAEVTGNVPLYFVFSGSSCDFSEATVVLCFEQAERETADCDKVAEVVKVLGVSEKRIIEQGRKGKTAYLFIRLPQPIKYGTEASTSVELFSDLWPTVPRADLEAALKQGANSPLCVAVGLPKYMVETLKILKPSRKFDAGTIVEQGIRWAAITFENDPTSIDLTIESQSPEAAAACQKMFGDLVAEIYKAAVSPSNEMASQLFSATLQTFLSAKIEKNQLRYRLPLDPDCVVPLMNTLGIPLDSVLAERDRIIRTNNMKQIGLAMLNYESAHGCFPPAYTVDKNGKPLHSWRVLILPYLEEGTLYKKIKLDEPWDSEYNKQFHKTVIDIYQNKDRLPAGQTHLSVVVGKETGFWPDGKKVTFRDIKDGASNTIMVTEQAKSVCWMEPTDVSFDAIFKTADSYKQELKLRDGALYTSFFDGSIRLLLPEKCSLRSLFTIDGKEPSEGF